MDKLKIEKLYCFIAENEIGEGVTGFHTGQGWMPLIGADMKRIDDLIIIAQNIANQTGDKITLCEFTLRTERLVLRPVKS